MRSRAVIVTLYWLIGSPAAAGPFSQLKPIVPAVDNRTDGPVALDVFEPWVGYAHIFAPTSPTGFDQDVGIYSFQIDAGPPLFMNQVGDVLGALDNYSLMVNGSVLRYRTDSGAKAVSGGPLTVALLRYFPLGPIAIAPLLNAHVGLDFTVATPWLAERHAQPPQALREIAGVDSELERSGWSIRPLGVFARADFLACRAFYLEAGSGFEGFVPSGASTEISIRYHAAAGFSLACSHADDTFVQHVAVFGEYRGRTRLYSDDHGVRAHDAVTVGMQFDWPHQSNLAFEAFLTIEPGAIRDYQMLGLRIQLGFKERQQ